MIIKRTRVKHEKTFQERLEEEVARYNELAQQIPLGMQRHQCTERSVNQPELPIRHP
jgi:hypothetical protein